MDLGKWHALAVGVLFLILAGLIFLTSDPRAAVSGPELLVREFMTPFQSGLSSIARWGSEAADAVGSLGRLREENRKLRQEVALYRAEIRGLEEYRRENDRLRAMLELGPRLPRETVVAQVVARPADHWFATITLNRGGNDGLAPGLPVVNAQGVVGHVESVTPHSARVILLVDSKSAVGGLILNSDAPVLVEGTADPTGREALVHPLVRGTKLRPGDRVVTSGLSRIFPKGLPVGVIEDVEEDRFGLQPQAVLRPYVDFGRLEWVAVLLQAEGDPVDWPINAVGSEVDSP